MPTLSLERVCLDVKQKGFQIPNVVQRAKGEAIKRVFAWLYACCDKHRLIELNADRISKETGVSRRQIYRCVNLLKKTKLLQLRASRTGRGKHSLFFVNWRKFDKKCASHISKDKILSPYKYDRPRRSNASWNQKLRAFRELLAHSWLLPREQALCTGVLGRHLKSRTTEYARQLYDALARIIGNIDAPRWVMTIQDLCRWWMSVIKGLMGQKRGLENACAA